MLKFLPCDIFFSFGSTGNIFAKRNMQGIQHQLHIVHDSTTDNKNIPASAGEDLTVGICIGFNHNPLHTLPYSMFTVFSDINVG